MVNLTDLYNGKSGSRGELRYGHARKAGAPRPVVVWNSTRRCNLACAHCYSASTDEPAVGELTTAEARAMIDDLVAFGAPVLLFSGGEPLRRADLVELVAYAKAGGLSTAISTNGTLINDAVAADLSRAGLGYAGVSLDGLAEANDKFRGRAGAFQRAIAGVHASVRAGVKVGLRFTMTRDNTGQIPGVLDLLEREGIRRICFYHLVPAGRAEAMDSQLLAAGQTRAVMDVILDRVERLRLTSPATEVLTVDNHCDGPYAYFTMARRQKRDFAAEQKCLDLLLRQGGNASGARIGCIGWNGDVFPDQFWRNHVLGNIRSRRFSEIWSDESNALLSRLRSRSGHLPQRCRDCRWLGVCNGNFRARAEAATGDEWGFDPGCYLTDEEVAR